MYEHIPTYMLQSYIGSKQFCVIIRMSVQYIQTLFKTIRMFSLVHIYTNNGQTLFRVDHKNPEKFTFHIKKEEQSSINILLIPTWIKGKENFLSLFLWFKIIKIFNKIKNWKYLVRTGKYKLFGSPKKTREKLNPFNSLWTTKQTKKKH